MIEIVNDVTATMKVLLSLLFALNIFEIKSFYLTELFDVNQFDSVCVTQYLNIERSNTSKNDFKRCNRDIKAFERSIWQTIEEILEGHDVEVKKCAINLLESYNITSVVFRALAYHQNSLNFTTNSQQSCEDVVKFNSTLSVMECGIKVLTVESIGVNKSFIHLKHCLNDLFHEFKADKILFNDSLHSEISQRLFGKHLMEFLMQLSMMGVKNCKNDEQIEVKDFEEVGIDFFGLTQPSKNVEKCIKENLKYEKEFKTLYKILFNNLEENFTISHKKINEIVLTCIAEF